MRLLLVLVSVMFVACNRSPIQCPAGHHPMEVEKYNGVGGVHEWFCVYDYAERKDGPMAETDQYGRVKIEGVCHEGESFKATGAWIYTSATDRNERRPETSADFIDLQDPSYQRLCTEFIGSFDTAIVHHR